MPRTTPLALAAFLGLTCLLAASADNWSRFRGPNGSGISADKDVPTQWTDKNVLWATPIPGYGISSPVLWGDKIFVQSSTDDKRMMVCVSAADGKILWSQEAPGGKAAQGQLNQKLNSLASSTPCTDGERVYGLFWDGKDITIHAFDMGGKPLWKRDLGGFNSQHGVGASPIVHEGKVFLNYDQDNKASIVALDAKTGEVAWEGKRKPFRACYSTPFIRETTDDGSELVVGSTAGLTGYNPKTGKENWNWTWEFSGMALRTVGAPVLSDGVLVAYSGDGKGDRSMVGVKLDGSGELSKDNLMWQKTKAGETPYVPCLVAQGDHLYGVNDKGFAQCYETKTGKLVWNERIDALGDVASSPLLINGHLYMIGQRGDVAVVPATPAYKEPLMSKVGEDVMATPAVANGKLFIRGKTKLYCIGKASAELKK